MQLWGRACSLSEVCLPVEGPQVFKRFSRACAALAVAAGIVAVPATAQAQDHCPAVVVVAARGSGQNNQVYPTWYSNQARSASNGWEGETIRAMLHTVEARYRATHGGASVMKDVHVLGLTPDFYPATFPDYYVPNVERPSTLQQVFGIVSTWAGPVINMATSAANQFTYSVQTGRKGVRNAIDHYEATSGCRPQYILTGFSQGAMVLAEHEKELAKRGQLAGVVYLGNPMTARNDPFTVGNTTGIGGPLGWTGNSTVGSRATNNRINYCLPLDGVCDMSSETLQAARVNAGGSHGRYFLWWSQWDNQVADAVGQWVDQVRYR